MKRSKICVPGISEEDRDIEGEVIFKRDNVCKFQNLQKTLCPLQGSFWPSSNINKSPYIYVHHSKNEET